MSKDGSPYGEPFFLRVGWMGSAGAVFLAAADRKISKIHSSHPPPPSGETLIILFILIEKKIRRIFYNLIEILFLFF